MQRLKNATWPLLSTHMKCSGSLWGLSRYSWISFACSEPADRGHPGCFLHCNLNHKCDCSVTPVGTCHYQASLFYNLLNIQRTVYSFGWAFTILCRLTPALLHNFHLSFSPCQQLLLFSPLPRSLYIFPFNVLFLYFCSNLVCPLQTKPTFKRCDANIIFLHQSHRSVF